MSSIEVFRLFASIGPAVGAILALAAALLTFVIASNPASALASSGIVDAGAPNHPSSVVRSSISSEIRSVLLQYHNGTSAVSPRIAPSIAHWNCCQIDRMISYQSRGGAQPEQRERLGLAKNAQYQADPRQYQDDELMLRIGLVLGMTYLAFLAIWIWATRLRPH
jgi:hypothetical protein